MDRFLAKATLALSVVSSKHGIFRGSIEEVEMLPDGSTPLELLSELVHVVSQLLCGLTALNPSRQVARSLMITIFFGCDSFHFQAMIRYAYVFVHCFEYLAMLTGSVQS